MVKGTFTRSNSCSNFVSWNSWILCLGFLLQLAVAVHGSSEASEYAEPFSMSVRQYLAQHPGHYYPNLYPPRMQAPYLRRIPLMGTNKRFDLGEDPRVTRKLVARNEGGAKSNDHQKLLVYRMFKRGGDSNRQDTNVENNEFPYYLTGEGQSDTL